MRFLFLIILSVIFWGCLGGSTENPIRYYTIAVEKIKIPEKKILENKTLLVQKWTIEHAYQKQNMVYRESPYDFMYDELNLWAIRPDQMFTQVSSVYLEQSNFFKKVTSNGNENADYEFLGKIHAIEEIDEEKKQFAHLSITISLTSLLNHSIIWEKKINLKKEMTERSSKAFTECISTLFAEMIRDGLQEIASLDIQ